MSCRKWDLERLHMTECWLNFRIWPQVSSRPTITCITPKKKKMFREAPACYEVCGEAPMHISSTHAKSLSLMKQRDKFIFCLSIDEKAPTYPDGAVPDSHQAQCLSKYLDGLKYEGMFLNKATPCPFLFFYLFLTVCHPVIGGKPSCIAWAFIFCWPCNNTKLIAGFPAACRKGLFSLFKYYLPWEPWSCAQALYCIFPASISACTLKVFRFHVLCSVFATGGASWLQERKETPFNSSLTPHFPH